MNSLADILLCGLGFVLARRLGFRRTVAPFVVTKMVLAVRIRDNLSLICLDADLPDRCDKVEVAKLLRAVRPEAY